jgi:hypothetical protein
MELKVNEVSIPEKITFNYEELKQEIAEKVKTYEVLVYDDTQIKQAKSDRANLNKLKKALNDERIRREKEYMQPFNVFKEQINEIISIIDKPVSMIDNQVKEYEQAQKQEKANKVMEMFNKLNTYEWLKLQQFADKRWSNSTYTLSKIEQDIKDRLDSIAKDLDIISKMPDFSFEATEVYKSTLDLQKSLDEGKRLAEIQARKEEEEKRRREEAERRIAEQERAQEEARIAEMEANRAKALQQIDEMQAGSQQAEEEPKQWVNFSAHLTVAQALELKSFFESKNIEFKAI